MSEDFTKLLPMRDGKTKADLTGKKFGRLTALEFLFSKGHHRYWKCVCECGNTTKSLASNLVLGYSKSCGCSRNDNRRTTHGEASVFHKSKEYSVWTGMKSRCTNKNRESYKSYGGKGITVCDRWMVSFQNFLEDMGRAPSNKHSLDRIDVNGNYEPGNCRWATSFEQSNNTTKSLKIEFNGEVKTLGVWCKELGLDHSRVYHRIKNLRWPHEKALTTPKLKGQTIRPKKIVKPIEYKGAVDSLAEHCRKNNASFWLVHGRLRAGWTLAKAIETPPDEKRRRKLVQQ